MYVYILILTLTAPASYQGGVSIESISFSSESLCAKAGNKWIAESRKRHRRIETSFTCNKNRVR